MEVNRFSQLSDKNPLLNISNFSGQILDDMIHEEYNHSIDTNFDNVMEYLNKDESIKTEDVAVLFESVDKPLLHISKESGIPYITLKVKRKRLKEKIKANVNI